MTPPHSAPASIGTASPPRLSVVIPLFNCLPLTQAMFASLRRTIPAGVTHEIIFIDDGSTDGTRDWLRSLQDPGIRVLLNERNLGYAVANNRAVAVARGEFLALLNNDLVLQPCWLEPMLAAHAALGRRAGVIGNVQIDTVTGAVDHAGLVIGVTGKPHHVRDRPGFLSRRWHPVRPVPAVTAACAVMEKALWQELGGFDTGYVNGGEDIDLCFRARAHGRINAVALGSVVRHHVSSSPGRKLRDEQNSYRLALRWRREFMAAADDGIRAWCRDFLTRAQSQDYRLALQACLYLARLRTNPPSEAVTAVEQGFRREMARWQEMFGSTPS